MLAVFVVQSQFGTMRVPILSEADRGEGGAISAHLIERENADAARPPGQAPAAAGARRAKAPEAAETDDYGYPDAQIAADSAGTGPRIGGPERELQAAHEMPEDLPAASPSIELPPPATRPPESAAADASPPDGDERFEQIIVTGSEARRADAPQEPPATTRIRPPPYEKSPEAWYAYIEKLRAQGRNEEADRQLARLEKAHPGWVQRYLRDRPQP